MTAVAVAIEHVAFVVDGDFVKIEEITIAVFSAAAPLPDAGVVLNGIVGCGIDRDPGATLVIGRGDKDIPHAGEVPVLVGGADRIGHIGADEAASGAARATAHRLGLRGVDDAVAGTNVHVPNPSYSGTGERTGSLADRDMHVALGATSLIIYVAVVGGAVRIQADGRICAVGLCCGGERRAAVYVVIAGDNKLAPSVAGIGAERTALLAGALIDRQPSSAIWSHVKVAVQPSTLGGNAIIREHSRSIAGAEIVAPLAAGATLAVLRAVKYHLALVYRVRKWIRQAHNEWIGSAPNGFVILATIRWRNPGLDPHGAVVKRRCCVGV